MDADNKNKPQTIMDSCLKEIFYIKAIWLDFKESN